MTDEILDEVRAARTAYGERFGFDIEAMGRDLRERARLSGRVVVSLPPKRVDPATGLPVSEPIVPAVPEPEPTLEAL